MAPYRPHPGGTPFPLHDGEGHKVGGQYRRIDGGEELRAIAEHAELVALDRGLDAHPVEQRRRVLATISAEAAETRAQLAHRERQRREGAAYSMGSEREHCGAAAFRPARQPQRRALREWVAHRTEVDDDQSEASRFEEKFCGLQFVSPFAFLFNTLARLCD